MHKNDQKKNTLIHTFYIAVARPRVYIELEVAHCTKFCSICYLSVVCIGTAQNTLCINMYIVIKHPKVVNDLQKNHVKS